MPQTTPHRVVVLCHNSEGQPEFHTCAPPVTQDEFESGEHLKMAQENAEANGFTGPMVAFDRSHAAAKELGDIDLWL